MRIRSASLVVAALTLLAGCAPGAPDPTPSTPPAASVTPTPTPEPPRAASLVLSAEGLRILDDDGGELGTTGFFDDPAQTIALLTETFGSEPEQVPYPGHIEAAPGIDYVWGGFTFRVQEFEPDPPMWPNQTVIVEGAVVSGVEIRTPGGFGIGTPSETLDASGAVGTGPYEDSEGNPQTFYEIDPVVVDTQEGYAYLNFLWVTVRDGVVIRISSPAANYGV